MADYNSRQHGAAIERMIDGLAKYERAHRTRFDSALGDDYVLGPAWLDALKGVRTLLNGETGTLDCGATDRRILDLARVAGFDEENM